MKITSSMLSTRLVTDEAIKLKRFQYANGEVDWEIVGKTIHWKIVKGNWFIYNQNTENYEPMTENIPTWEQEYQSLLKQTKD